MAGLHEDFGAGHDGGLLREWVFGSGELRGGRDVVVASHRLGSEAPASGPEGGAVCRATASGIVACKQGRRDSALAVACTRTAHCLKLGSRLMGSKAPSVTRLEFVSAKWKGMKTWPGAMMAVMRSSTSGDVAAGVRRVTRVVRAGVRGARRRGDSSRARRWGPCLLSMATGAGLGAGVPVLDGAAGVEDDVVFGVGLLGEGLARDAVEKGAAALAWERRRRCRGARRPTGCRLGGFDLRPRSEGRVVAEAAGGDALPLGVGVVRWCASRGKALA